jgi:hypothetical protein
MSDARGTKDWYSWHAAYADSDSSLSRRLRVIQQEIESWLDERSDPSLTVVSLCAGQGRDLLEVLANRPDAARIRGHLVEYDQRNVAVARDTIRTAGLSEVTVLHADAGDLATYSGMPPADLVLLVGVLGNISDSDVRATIAALPQMCAAGATLIWTRTRKAPDLTPAVRRWLATAGFVERAFHAPDDVRFSVGVHRFLGQPQTLRPNRTLFRVLN